MALSPTVRRVIVFGGSALIVLGLLAFGWWWTHPTLFSDLSGEYSADPRPVDQAAVALSVTYPPMHGGAVVDLRSASAHFRDDSVAARATFVICRGTTPLGLVDGDLAKWCTSVLDLPATLQYKPSSDETVVMRVQPTRPGRVVIDSVTLDYRRGADHLWQQGTQTIQVGLTLTAR